MYYDVSVQRELFTRAFETLLLCKHTPLRSFAKPFNLSGQFFSYVYKRKIKYLLRVLHVNRVL